MLKSENFWEQVNKTGECWLWMGRTQSDGYGSLSREGKEYLAHRVAWELTFGPTDLKVLHRCDNPPCVRPAHLFEGTQRDNIADMVAKGRQHRPVGTLNPKAKLNPTLADEIRGKYVPGNISALAKEYGVATSTIWRVISQESWAQEVANGTI